MKRAAVLIAVERSGDLPVLQDAAAGARRMEAWAKRQQFDSIDVLTDEDSGVVEPGMLKKAVNKIVDAHTFEQLLIYFAGHGVNRNYGEYWLLSDAPKDTQAAVNVQSSAALAAQSVIPHVIFISDACRTAPEGIQAGQVTGSEIFPNDGGGGTLMKPIDQFWACLLGRPAHEIADPATTTQEYTAVYTAALLDALEGRRSDIVDWAAGPPGYVRVRPLKAYLHAEVSRRIKDLRLQTRVIQEPDALIVSDDSAWLARLTTAPRAFEPFEPFDTDAEPVVPAPASTASLASALLKPALAADSAELSRALVGLRGTLVESASELAGSVARGAQPFGPTQHETGCGFKVRGSRFTTIDCFQATAERVTDEIVRMVGVPAPGASVLLGLQGGAGVALPAIPGFLGALTVEDGELTDVAYEPSENSWRWSTFNERAEHVRSLRAVASAATRSGVFRLEGDDALAFARAMQREKGVDPTLAIYAAYAYQDLRRHDLIESMHNYLRDDLGASFFDIGLLARAHDAEVLGFAPLLAQGWPLLPALRRTRSSVLEALERTLLPSVWTLYDRQGVEMIRKAMRSGELR